MVRDSIHDPFVTTCPSCQRRKYFKRLDYPLLTYRFSVRTFSCSDLKTENKKSFHYYYQFLSYFLNSLLTDMIIPSFPLLLFSC